MPRDLDRLPFDPKIYGFSGLLAEHFHVEFSDPISAEVLRYRADKQTDRKRRRKPCTATPSAWVITDHRTDHVTVEMQWS